MKKTFAVVLIFLIGCGQSLGQSRRLPNYSESSSQSETKTTRSKNDSPRAETKKFESEKSEQKKIKPENADEIIRIETDLVTIPARISERSGKAVVNLRQEEFKIFENGVEQEIAYFSGEEQPFTVALVLDMSYSSAFKLREIQNAALAFVDQLRADDKLTVISFDEEVRVLCEPTSDRKILRLAIEGTRIASGTSLYTALDAVLAGKFSDVAGRKAIVVLGDGVDTTSREITVNKILNAANETDVLIYPIQYDTYDDVQKSRKDSAQVFFDDDDRPVVVETPKIKGEKTEDYETADAFLQELAARTGGRVYPVSSTTKLNEAFANVADELRKIYSLGYYPSGQKVIGARYDIKVRVYRPNLNIRAKDSYFWKPNSVRQP